MDCEVYEISWADEVDDEVDSHSVADDDDDDLADEGDDSHEDDGVEVGGRVGKFRIIKYILQLLYMQYIRFQTTHIDEMSTKPLGIFQIAYEVRDSWLPPYQKEYLADLLSRFDDHLEEPTTFSRKSGQTATRGISRYKSTAQEHLTKMYEIARVLWEHDIYVEIVTTDTPGYIVYEDEVQVVGEPYK